MLEQRCRLPRGNMGPPGESGDKNVGGFSPRYRELHRHGHPLEVLQQLFEVRLDLLSEVSAGASGLALRDLLRPREL